MSVVAALAAGSVVGLRHSLEADHLAAIAALVDGEGDHAGLVGAAWGVGHAVPVVAVGVAFLVLGTRLPDAITALFELLAGLVLVALGVRLLLGVGGGTDHEHDGGSHDHEVTDPAADGHHTHLSIGSLDLGLTHSHRHDESFLVGVVHGLAGSGALVVVLVTSAPTVEASLSFLAAFTVVSVTTMGVLAFLWGHVLSSGATRLLRSIAGAVSVAVGVALLARELLGVDGPFDVDVGHEHGPHGDHVHALGHEHVPIALDAGWTATEGLLVALALF